MRHQPTLSRRSSGTLNKGAAPTPYAQPASTSPLRIEGELWTSRQRQASSLHEISYRACFKPQLPRYFIERYTRPGDTVYDPFMGRGTTVIEAALLGRNVAGNDVNPLSRILTQPRLEVPGVEDVARRLDGIAFSHGSKAKIDLSMFYHPATEAEIISLRRYLAQRRRTSKEDELDRWIRMVATNRLTGHSVGFFSVYTLPPNQATLPENQKRINRLRRQKPEYRDVKQIILKKTKTLLARLSEEEKRHLFRAGTTAQFFSSDARGTKEINPRSVQLTVTSPPFLNIVQYSNDNWLRCWFNEIDVEEISQKITTPRSLEEWCDIMAGVFRELHRITALGGYVAFEVGEVRKGSVRLEEFILPIGSCVGFDCEGILINRQQFTKTANIWGVRNNSGGTNSNRIILFRKPR